MTPRLSAGCLITVLGASAERRHALTCALHERLSARLAPEIAVEVLLLGGPDAADHAGWMAAHQQALQTMLARSIVLSEGGFPQAVAQASSGASASAALPDLQAASQTQLARSALVLLCATDGQATSQERELDSRLRAQLLAARASFSVVHGEGSAALAQAWQALCVTVDRRLDTETPADQRNNAAWRWSCDKCSDPACEHRMFSDLVAQRGDKS